MNKKYIVLEHSFNDLRNERMEIETMNAKLIDDLKNSKLTEKQ
jgi:hypothetical protein